MQGSNHEWTQSGTNLDRAMGPTSELDHGSRVFNHGWTHMDTDSEGDGVHHEKHERHEMNTAETQMNSKWWADACSDFRVFRGYSAEQE